MTTNQIERVSDEELDQMIWKLERDGMTPKQLSLMRELREVRRAVKPTDDERIMAIEGISPQFKPVADLYGITSPTGSETSFTFDAIEAANFIDGGWSCQEYVELERYQEAMIGNSPATPDGWIPVSERLPDDTVDADGGATCHLVFYAEGRQPNGGSNVQVSNVTYLRRWHEGMITHWMPLPASPQQEAK